MNLDAMFVKRFKHGNIILIVCHGAFAVHTDGS